jgi:hypothetical protein
MNLQDGPKQYPGPKQLWFSLKNPKKHLRFLNVLGQSKEIDFITYAATVFET